MPLLFLVFLGVLGGTVPVPPSDPAPALPEVGPWLLDRDGQPARWLGHPYRGKTLYEPINLVVLDRFSPTKDLAVRKLLGASALGGYKIKAGHSCGYRGLIDGFSYPQIPREKNTALADREPYLTNNHGRILGPAPFRGQWVFTGAFSREAFTLFSTMPHQFVSFNQARDDYGRCLAGSGLYRIAGLSFLGNQLGGPGTTTADHDGQVLVLEAVR